MSRFFKSISQGRILNKLAKLERKLQKVNDKRARLKQKALLLTAEYEKHREEARQHLKSNTL